MTTKEFAYTETIDDTQDPDVVNGEITVQVTGRGAEICITFNDGGPLRYIYLTPRQLRKMNGIVERGRAAYLVATGEPLKS